MKKIATVNVIGAGLGGLTLAAHLARQGVGVEVFEALNQLGGFVHSFSRKGYTFEATTHQIAGHDAPGYFRKNLAILGIDDVPLQPMSTFIESCMLDAEGRISTRYAIPAGAAEFRRFLEEHAPDHRAEIASYLETLERISSDLFRLRALQRERPTLRQFPDVVGALALKHCRPRSPLWRIGAALYPAMVANTRRTQADLNAVLPEPLRSLLAQHYLYVGAPPSETSAVLGAAMLYLYVHGRPFTVRGGTRALIDRLEQAIVENGGTIHRRQPIAKILVEQGRATGVVTAEGRRYPADFTVSNISSKRTMLDLVGREHLTAGAVRAVEKLKLSRSAFQVFIGARLRLEEHGWGASTMALSQSLDHEASFLEGAAGPTSTTPMLVTNYSVHDDSFAPAGCSSFVAVEFDDYGRWRDLGPEAYRAQKQRTQDLMIDKLERAFGLSLRDSIDVVFSGTPLTFQRYSSGTEAEVYGPTPSIDQSLGNRTPMQTAIERLYLVGAYTQPSHGVATVMDSGIVLGNIIAKEARRAVRSRSRVAVVGPGPVVLDSASGAAG
jgi:all-trans-retinol 13,14-reductase